MFLNDLFQTEYGQKLNKFARENSTFNACYLYWRDQLFERVMRMFVWENTGVIKPKEIEQRLLINGHCGIAEYKGELTAFFGSFYGVTKYMDEWTNYNVRCPIYSGSKVIGKDVIVIDNNSIRNPLMPLIHHYAILLGHTEVTLVNMLVNARDAGGVPIASTEKQKNSIMSYLGKLFNGEYSVVTDIGSLGIEYAGTDRNTKQDLISLVDTREKIIKNFYTDLGIRSSFEKRNNTVVAEVQSDSSLLRLNISDMLRCREIGAGLVNERFGTNWSVHIADEINYEKEIDEYYNAIIKMNSGKEQFARANTQEEKKDDSDLA